MQAKSISFASPSGLCETALLCCSINTRQRGKLPTEYPKRWDMKIKIANIQLAHFRLPSSTLPSTYLKVPSIRYDAQLWTRFGKIGISSLTINFLSKSSEMPQQKSRPILRIDLLSSELVSELVCFFRQVQTYNLKQALNHLHMY